ncbi:MAG: hypothetical protein ACRD4U_09780 [Candidatus Acidiferrales bacterium]
MKNFLASLGMSALPRAWWRGWEPESTVYFRWAAVASGVLQFVLFFFATARLYIGYVGGQAGTYGGVAGGGAGGIISFGFVTLEFLLYPHHLLAGYLMAEGLARAGAAFIADEVAPSLPLWLAARLLGRAGARAAEAALGLRVPDTVERVEGLPFDLRIASCRPKDKWKDKLLTIAFEEQFYEVVREEHGPRPRQFIYLLRKAPDSKVIRGVHHYHPNESLQGD